ncbi:MAG: hypothetical protein AB7T10_02705 [bacterium]
MKKNLITVIAALLLFAFLPSCSLLNQSTLNPPSWIIGSWSDDYDIFTWEFAEDNVLYHSSIEMDYKALALNPDVEITEEVGDDAYSFTYKTETTSTDYSFEFVDDTTINYSIDNSIPVVLHKD